MDIGDRIKLLRKRLNMNQADFATPLGLRQSTIGNYESGSRGISDATILAICREYGANEEWLRTGSGEMFAAIPATVVSELAREHDLDDMDQAIIAEYLKLDKGSRAVLKDYIKRVYLASDPDAAIDREVAAYRKELEAEKGEKSSALDTIREKEA